MKLFNSFERDTTSKYGVYVDYWPETSNEQHLLLLRFDKKYCFRYAENTHGMSFKFEYLSEINSVFKTNIGYKSGDQLGSLYVKHLCKSNVNQGFGHTYMCMTQGTEHIEGKVPGDLFEICFY